MSQDETNNLLLEHLRTIRATLERHNEKLDEVTLRLGWLEREVARLHDECAACVCAVR